MSTYQLWVSLLCKEWEDFIISYFVKQGFSVKKAEAVNRENTAAYHLSLVLKSNDRNICQKTFNDFIATLDNKKCSIFFSLMVDQEGYIVCCGTNIFLPQKEANPDV